MTTAFYSPDECRGHRMGDHHPECPERISAILDHLRATGLDIALDFRDSPDVERAQLERAHASAYVAHISDLMSQAESQGQARAVDPDTSVSPGTRAAALKSAGAAIAATDAVIDRSASNAFCAVRPPGHHATRDEAMGFCFFNNVAAVSYTHLRAHET